LLLQLNKKQKQVWIGTEDLLLLFGCGCACQASAALTSAGVMALVYPRNCMVLGS
jgi:hypothetical protein